MTKEEINENMWTLQVGDNGKIIAMTSEHNRFVADMAAYIHNLEAKLAAAEARAENEPDASVARRLGYVESRLNKMADVVNHHTENIDEMHRVDNLRSQSTLGIVARVEALENNLGRLSGLWSQVDTKTSRFADLIDALRDALERCGLDVSPCRRK